MSTALSFTSLIKTRYPVKEILYHAKPCLSTLAVFFFFLCFHFRAIQSISGENPMNVKRITPVLSSEIEPLLPFWVDRLGFSKTIEVPDGNKLAFVTFQKAPPM